MIQTRSVLPTVIVVAIAGVLTVIDGPSIVDGTLYWGSGYRSIQGTGNNKVYAFSLAGENDHGEHSGDNDDHNHDHDHSDDHGGQN